MTARRRANRTGKAPPQPAEPSSPGLSPESWPASKVELWPLDRIKPYDRNPKIHPEPQIELIAASMREDGVTAPILVDEAGVIIYGHGRRLAAQRNGYTTYPVVQALGWTEERKRAVRIKDNSYAALAGWNAELIKVELTDLKLAGYEMPLLGFGEAQLRGWGVAIGTAGPEPEKIPETPKHPVVRKGDLWMLDEHRLLCGDATVREDVARIFSGKATTVTDPPYGVGFEYRSHDDAKLGNADLVKAAFANCPEAKIWTPGRVNLARELAAFPDAYTLCWHKGFAAARSGHGGASTWEPVLLHRVKNGRLPNDYLYFATDREESPVAEGKMLRDEHPCPKPVALFEHLIACLTPNKGLVVDPFSGSGTTLIAAETTGRAFAGVEIDPAYVELSIIRWQRFTGRQATLDGKTLDQVTKARATKRAARRAAPSGNRAEAR